MIRSAPAVSSPLSRAAADRDLSAADALAVHFTAPCCHNCSHALSTPFCGQCGQEKARRLTHRAVRGEVWQNWRWFELDTVKAAWRLATQPGTVAREFVLGARKKHVHPLKLLLIAIGVMLLVMSQSHYLDSANVYISRAMELMRHYSNWSFSLTILAILASSLIAFPRRGGYNLTEHLVLAAYCEFLVICASVLSKLPTLIWRAPEFLALHKATSFWFLHAIGVAIIAVAFTQFFRLDLRRDAGRLVLAALVFVGLKWSLQNAYAWALVKLVLAQTA